MDNQQTVCLVANTASGSYSPEAVDDLATAFRGAGFDLCRSICFPDEDLPTTETLAGSNIDILAIFTGDGTVNSCVTGLYGWKGKVLVLPGGTMNLLSHQLHGEAEPADIVAQVASGAARVVRRNVARSAHGDALVGLSAGPATSWYTVREAMREADIQQMVDEAGEAYAKTVGDEAQLCIREPDVGDREGYPLVEICPCDAGLRLVAYNPKTLGDYIAQGWKMLIRRFREGPHETLGTFDRLVLAGATGAPIELSIDGEPTLGEPVEEVVLAEADVDLLATA